MLLHKSNINVAIAVILSLISNFYDLPGPKCKNAIFTPEGNLENMPPRVRTSDTETLPR